jgi:hypothetical protein
MASRGSKSEHFGGKLGGAFEKQPPKLPFFELSGI